MKQVSMMIDLNRCIGCRTCVVACRNHKEIIDHNKAVPDDIPYYLRVETREKGTFPNLSMDTWVVPCQHCGEPKCETSCPEGAISKAPETGIVIIDPEKCTGCEAKSESIAVEKRKVSPCKGNCPANINVQGYVNLAAQGKFQEALKLIKDENPFPAICGRVCHHPCESDCSRSDVDEPVAINAIKRFISDLDLDPETRYVPEIKEKKDEKVAIIGAGPAGLTSAFYLAKEGYQVNVFDRLPVAGGMMAVGIPEYRLPNDILEAEISVIRDMGVEIQTGVTLGEDISLDSLKEDGFEAVFMATGLHFGGRLDVDGEDLPGVFNGLDLLKDSALGKKIEMGEKAIVIGGGNAAIDSALSAKRLGAKKVTLVCLEHRDEMPAWDQEIADALEEGIEIVNGLGPLRFMEKDGRLSGIEFQLCTSVFNEKGEFDPQYDDCQLTIMETDSAIIAISLLGERDFAENSGIALTSAGGLWADPITLQTRIEWLFAGGDTVSGPKTVVEAIASGKEAAISIDRYIRGVNLSEDRAKEMDMVSDVYKAEYDPAKRAQMPRLKPEERVGNFNEIEQGFTEEMVIQEAKRCLNCGCSCIQSCPFSVIQFDGEGGKSHKCDLCQDRIYAGELPVCAEVCMTEAITFGEYDLVKQWAVCDGRTIVTDLSKGSMLYIK
ncbi:MAG: FAD-dependent oxidoreductase [Desulfobacterales bacterium]|nr:MAG: FAD-dependent oxidoreductase [Desulfobacterales bacterium]